MRRLFHFLVRLLKIGIFRLIFLLFVNVFMYRYKTASGRVDTKRISSISIELVQIGMPNLSNRCSYALRAMLELAKREGSGPVKIGAIADSQRIPVRFLEAILRQLKQAGLATSQRGKDGGYRLSRRADSIGVGEIIQLFEESWGEDREAKEPSQTAAATLFQNLCVEADEAWKAVYDKVTFENLLRRERALQEEHVANYSI